MIYIRSAREQAIRIKVAANLTGLSRWLGLTLLAGLVLAAGALIFFAGLADEMLAGNSPALHCWGRELANSTISFRPSLRDLYDRLDRFPSDLYLG